MALLNVNGLDLHIGETHVCQQLSFSVETGQRWAVLGCNGIGKSTLLLTMAGLRETDKSVIQLEDQDLCDIKPQQIAQTLGILFQKQDDTFDSTVLETALIGRHPFLKAWQWESAEDHDLAMQALKSVSLEHLAQRSIQTLSGGERQRLAVATILTQSPKLTLLDEPTNHLDIHHQISVLNLLQKWSQQNDRALMMTLHDVNLALRYCDHAILLFGEGETLAGPTNEILTQENLEKLYLHPLNRVGGDWGQAYLPR